MDLNVEAKTIKVLEETTGENLSHLGLGKEFLDTIPKVQYNEGKK